MKIAFYFNILLCCALFLVSSCTKDQEVPDVTIDIKVPEPVISTLSNGSKRLDFTIEVTQTGNFFYQDFDFSFTKPDGTVLDSYHTLLLSAHEFVQHTVVVTAPGTYKANVFIGPSDSGAGSGSTVVVPN